MPVPDWEMLYGVPDMFMVDYTRKTIILLG
jgi:hypothetical protein